MTNASWRDRGSATSARDAASSAGRQDDHWHAAADAIAARHWRRTRALVAALMVIGGLVTFAPQFWARELSTVRFAGWPLPFYMGAQGSILFDLFLIVVFVAVQRGNDARYRRDLHALRESHRAAGGRVPDETDTSSERVFAMQASQSSRAAGGSSAGDGA